jgi:hypothetical protein
MPIAISPDEEFEYVLEEDRDAAEDRRTVFYLKPMPADQYYRTQDGIFQSKPLKGRRGETTQQVRTGYQEETVLLNGIARVEKFANRKGEVLRWPATGGRDDKIKFLSHLRPAHRRELFDAILGDATLPETAVRD